MKLGIRNWVIRLPARIAIGLIRAYQFTLSPLVGRACRFYPTCSNYAREAIESHGLPRGTWLAVRRLLKCHPFHPGGVDLVPATGSVAKDPPPASAFALWAPADKSRTPPEEGGMARIPSLGGVAAGRGGFNS